MELLPRHLLLLRDADHHRLRRLRGAAAGQLPAANARVRGLRALLHHVRAGHHRRLAQPHGAQVHDHEHGGRAQGRAAGHTGERYYTAITVTKGGGRVSNLRSDESVAAGREEVREYKRTAGAQPPPPPLPRPVEGGRDRRPEVIGRNEGGEEEDREDKKRGR